MTTRTRGFTVDVEPFSSVRGEIIQTLNSNRDHPLPDERFDWLYLNNPDGEATVWTVRAEKDRQMAGFTVALPRRVLVDGDIHRCWNCADFSIHPKFRSLGVALKLRRAAKEGIDAGHADFLYAHPNARMQVIHEKVGHLPIGLMVRYARLLRAQSFLRERTKKPLLASVAAPPVNAAIYMVSRHWQHRLKCRIEFESIPRFDERFDDLFERAGKHYPVVGVRDSRYLAWRYTENPLQNTQALLAYRNESLVGYALFTVDGRVAHVVDMFADRNEETAADLIAGLTGWCYKLNIERISMIALEGNPMLAAAPQFGFKRRAEKSTVFGYAAETSPLRKTVLDQGNWFLTVGDRDQ